MSDENLKNICEKKELRKSLTELKASLSAEGKAEELKADALYGTGLFTELLKNEDPKVRKNAALVMGMLGDDEYRQHLYEGYLNETKMFVKSSYLKSLRSYDYTVYEEVLRSRMSGLKEGNFKDDEVKHAAEELKELKIMFPEATEHVRHEFKNPEKSMKIVLTARREMSGYLKNAVEKITGNARNIFCGVMTDSRETEKLSAIRIYREMLFPVNNLKPMNRNGLAKSIVSGDLFDILNSLHAENGTPYYFRVSSADTDSAAVAGEIEAVSGNKLVNSVSDYEIELRLISDREGGIGCLLKLFTYKDRRFLYRKNHIATSLHPANAAMMAEAAAPYLAGQATVLDPFCGVGTLLIERNKKKKASNLYGVDIYGEAVEYARENAMLADVGINFIRKDFFDFRHGYLFDEIITEMPVPDRNAADELYRRFFEKSFGLLKKDGIIIMYSAEMGIIKKYLRLHGGYELINSILMDAKKDGRIYIIRKTEETK